MSRKLSLPAGVESVSGASAYRALHALVIETPTPLRLCDGPIAVTIGGNVYSPSSLSLSSVSLISMPSFTVTLPNGSNEISQRDFDKVLMLAPLKVYEVYWSAAGAQLSEVPIFDGVVTSARYQKRGAEVTAKSRGATTAGMVGSIIDRLCSYRYKGVRCGAAGGAIAQFTRASTAYKQDGTQVTSGNPRYETAKFDKGITAEVGATNLLTANQSSAETDTTGVATYNGGTLTRDTTEYWQGAASFKLVAAAANMGVQTPVASGASLGAALPFAAQVRVKGTNTKRVQLFCQFWDSGNNLLSTSTPVVQTLDGSTWFRIQHTGTTPASTYKIGWVVQSLDAANTFYVDATMIENRAYCTTWQLGGAARNAEVIALSNIVLSASTGVFRCWLSLFRAPGTNAMCILDGGGATNKNLKVYVKTNGKVEVVYGTGSSEITLTGTTVLAASTLYHVAVVWSALGGVLYVQGSPEDSDAAVPSLTPGSFVYLGSNAAGAEFLDGVLDDVVFEDVIWTDVGVATDYAAAAQYTDTSHTLTHLTFSDMLIGTGNQPCDHTMARCTALGNILRYGGWPSMLQIGQKVSYTVTTPQARGERAGTKSPAAQTQAPRTDIRVPRKVLGRG